MALSMNNSFDTLLSILFILLEYFIPYQVLNMPKIINSFFYTILAIITKICLNTSFVFCEYVAEFENLINKNNKNKMFAFTLLSPSQNNHDH